MDENKEYRITRLGKDNLTDVAKLHAEVYNTDPPFGYFLKKYSTAYTGVEYAGFIAYNRDTIPVAYYGVIPCFIRYKGQVILAAQSADTMTHPEYRYKGMFVELSNMTFDLCQRLNIRLVFGFPNQNSYHGAVNKLGWKMTHAMDYFVVPVNALPLEKLFSKFKLLKTYYERYQRSILKKYVVNEKGIPHSAETGDIATVYRNKDYLQYKTYSHTEVIKAGDATVWISRKHGFSIGDIQGASEKNFSHIMEHVKRIARKAGIRQVEFHCSPGIHLHDLFSAYFKPSPSYPALFQDFGSPVPPEKVKFTFADIDIF
jgi:hypothetical protein